MWSLNGSINHENSIPTPRCYWANKSKINQITYQVWNRDAELESGRAIILKSANFSFYTCVNREKSFRMSNSESISPNNQDDYNPVAVIDGDISND